MKHRVVWFTISRPGRIVIKKYILKRGKKEKSDIADDVGNDLITFPPRPFRFVCSLESKVVTSQDLHFVIFRLEIDFYPGVPWRSLEDPVLTTPTMPTMLTMLTEPIQVDGHLGGSLIIPRDATCADTSSLCGLFFPFQIGCCGADGPVDYLTWRKPLPSECRDTVTGNAFFHGCVDELTWFLEDKSAWLAGVAMTVCCFSVSTRVPGCLTRALTETTETATQIES